MSDQFRAIANEEIDEYSVRVIGYDRQTPNAGQRKPAEILHEVEERMALNKARYASLQKALGAVLLIVMTFILTTSMTGVWPSFMAWLKAIL